ncbi:hypothetical protein K525DRAFT_266871 [Schizophyllum commune Loenen D]|nr:hypothetical protein K525DRAFT_266871 [Schizophyllum commune Loenen D]
MNIMFPAQQESTTICATCHQDISCSIIDVPLASGHVPSPSEARAVEAIIEETRAQLAKVQHAIGNVDQTLDSLSTLQSKLENALAMQRAYVAPVRRVPVEVLEMIFELSCEDATIDPSDCTPLALSAVCRLWRHIVLGTPRVWADLQLTNMRFEGWSARQMVVGRLKHCLRMANGLPLTQPIHANSTTGSSGLNLFSVLLKHTAQWQHLQLDGPLDGFDPRQPHSTCVFLNRPYPRLHTLDIEMAAFYSILASCAFSNLPALHTLVIRNPKHLGNSEPALNVHGLHLPLAQLQELRTRTTTRFAFELLSRCPNLLRWTHNDESSSYREPASAAVNLPHLQSLHAAYNNARCSIDLNFIVAPSLESLKLSWHNPYLSTSAPAFTLLQRSRDTLRELELDNPPPSLRHDLAMLNHVHTLALHSPSADPLTDNILAAFMTRNEDGTLAFLPILENLELGGHGRYRGQAAVDMVNARRAAGRPLQTLDLDLFNVDMQHFGNLDALERLRQLVPEFVGSG